MAEYGANYIAYLQAKARAGVEIVVVPNDESGQISIDALRDAVDERTRLISVTHVPTSGGLVNPAVAVGQVAREANCLFLLDACQSVGQMPINVASIGCHVLSTTARKYLRGPRGVGLLYVSNDVLSWMEPFALDVRGAEWVELDRYEMRPDARRFETWEVSYALQLGLGAAIDYALSLGIGAIWSRVQDLAAMLRHELSALPDVVVLDRGQELCGIITFSVRGLPAQRVRERLARARVNVWVSTPDDTRLEFEERHLDPIVRASVHYFNTEEEISRFCAALERLTDADE
jgi:cysteine desulfurase/selenocysteine lyase